MKGYEDLFAGLCLLVVVLVGGYTYLQSEVFKQKQSLQVATVKDKVTTEKHHSDKFLFERLVKTTE